MKKFVIGIDASNIRAGGGLTYLSKLLEAGACDQFSGSRVVVWGGNRTLSQLPSAQWITKSYQPLLDGALPYRVSWQRRYLDRHAASCDLLFVPGGTYIGSFRPFVAMSHNLLPFEPTERRRYGASPTRFRLELLRFLQSRTFRRADGVIFLTRAAKAVIEATTGVLAARHAVIPHGIDPTFLRVPREQRVITSYSHAKPFRWLYVSIVNLYKHQWNVVAAAAEIRASGVPIELDLVGPAYPPALRKLRDALSRYDPESTFIRYHGPLRGGDLVRAYHDADALVFASTCENMPIILLEGMAAGLPIVCGDRPVMREVLGAGGAYCDPERVDDLARAMREITLRPDLRDSFAKRAYTLASGYNWRRSAEATFAFLQQIAAGDH